MSIASKANKILNKLTGKSHSWPSKSTEQVLDAMAREDWNFYDKEEVRELISQQDHLSFTIVDELPTENIRTDRIYLVPSSDPGEENAYIEYVYIDGNWEMIGTSEINLDDYYTKSEIDNMIGGVEQALSEV